METYYLLKANITVKVRTQMLGKTYFLKNVRFLFKVGLFRYL